MPEEIEIETNELQDKVSELQEELSEERTERKAEEERERAENAWTRYVAMSTAMLAVFAAIGALQSGSLVNEAMIDQLKASDTWNQYQSARQKEYLFTLDANALLDRGGVTAPSTEASSGGDEKPATESKPKATAWKALPPQARLNEYARQVAREQDKQPELSKKAEELEKEANRSLRKHEEFAWSVAMIQVAIALSAISALTRQRFVWYISLAVGIAGLCYFVTGFFGG